MGTSLFWGGKGGIIQPTTPSSKEKKYARTLQEGVSLRGWTSDAAGLQRDPSGTREGGSRWFYFVCCDAYFYSLAAFPLEFNKVPFEGSSPSWLCCKEPGSWTRVTDGTQLTCAKVVSADIKVRPWWGGSEGIIGSLRHTGCPPGSLFSGSSLGESRFRSTKEGDVFYPGL